MDRDIAKAQALKRGKEYDLEIFQMREEESGLFRPCYPDYNNKVLVCNDVKVDHDIHTLSRSVLSRNLTDPRRFPIYINPVKPSAIRCYRFEYGQFDDQMEQQLRTKRPVLAPALFECDLDQNSVRISPETISDPLLRMNKEAINCMEAIFTSMLPMIAGVYEDKEDLRKLSVAIEIEKWNESGLSEAEDAAYLDQYNSLIRATAVYVLDYSADSDPIELEFGQMLTRSGDSDKDECSDDCFVAYCEFPILGSFDYSGFPAVDSVLVAEGGAVVYVKDQPYNMRCSNNATVVRFLLLQPQGRPVIDNYREDPDMFPRGVTMPEWSTVPFPWFWFRDLIHLKKHIPLEVIEIMFSFVADVHVPRPSELSTFKILPKLRGRYKHFMYDQWGLIRFEQFPIFWHISGKHVVKPASESKKVACIELCYLDYEYVYNVTFVYTDGTKSSHGGIESSFSGYEDIAVTRMSIRLGNDQYIEQIRGSSSDFLHTINFKLSGNESFELPLTSQDLAPTNFDFSMISSNGKCMPIIDIVTEFSQGGAPAIQGAVFGASIEMGNPC